MLITGLLWNKEPYFPLNGILLCEPESSAVECLMTSIFFKNGRRGKCLPPPPEYLRYVREGEENSSVADIFLSYFLFVIKKKKLQLLTNNSVRPLITGSTSSAIRRRSSRPSALFNDVLKLRSKQSCLNCAAYKGIINEVCYIFWGGCLTQLPRYRAVLLPFRCLCFIFT